MARSLKKIVSSLPATVFIISWGDGPCYSLSSPWLCCWIIFHSWWEFRNTEKKVFHNILSLPPALAFFLDPLWWSPSLWGGASGVLCRVLLPFSYSQHCDQSWVSRGTITYYKSMLFWLKFIATLIISAAMITIPDKGNLREKIYSDL